jgi:hypothetical protein
MDRKRLHKRLLDCLQKLQSLRDFSTLGSPFGASEGFLGAGIYDLLTDAFREEMSGMELQILVHNGVEYAYAGFGVGAGFTFTVDGDMIRCEMDYGMDEVSVLVLQRTSDTTLTVLEIQGTLPVYYWNVGDVLTAK